MSKRLSLISAFVCCLIWGTTFIAQDTGMDEIGPFTFNGVRFFVGFLALVPFFFVIEKNKFFNEFNKDIINLINMKENIFIVYDISEINNWYPLNTYIKNAKKLFSSTKLIKGNMKACSIIVNSNYINTLKFVLKIINAFGICDYYITDKLDLSLIHI